MSLENIHLAGGRHFVARLVEAGELPNSVNNILVLLKTIVKNAVEDGTISSNPETVVKRMKRR